MDFKYLIVSSLALILCNSCQSSHSIKNTENDTVTQSVSDTLNITHVKALDTSNMVKIPAGVYSMGAYLASADANEKPQHQVEVKAFWMDDHEVTNGEFAKFVKETGYITTAEKKPDWEELKKQLPPGTPKPAEENMVPAGLVFHQPTQIQGYEDYSQWWSWVAGANWQHPKSAESNIIGKENEPVVQVSWEDAMAYCRWAHKRLPTEAEWEWAARGGLKNKLYPWGDEQPEVGKVKANIWQGNFPMTDAGTDGFKGIAPVKSFAPNGYHLYDMAGNVWEWTADWYNANYYQECAKHGVLKNPRGANTPFDPLEPYAPKKVIRGGSFLCNAIYCTGYRVSRRMQSTYDTGTNHIGFRCVSDL